LGKVTIHPEQYIGKRFSKLVITSFSHRNSKSEWQVKVRCDCGTKKIVSLIELKRGSTKACGCLVGEWGKIHKKIHGCEKHPLYHTWHQMMRRCHNEKSHAYKYYGGRGIFVDKRWHDVRNFIEDMIEKPKGMSLDRINNNGPYSKDNCRWATAKMQAMNTRKTKFATILGETKTVYTWMKLLNISYYQLKKAKSRGCSDVEAILVCSL
jgi:hypothetical protein